MPVVVHPDLTVAMRACDPLSADTSAIAEADNLAYGAAISTTGLTRFRVAKLTPQKAGLFVAVWQRAADGSTEPLSAGDGTRSLVITVREGDDFGMFVLSTRALIEHGIVAVDGAGGKRGFRVYPPWSATASSQAKKSQRWQGEFFVDLSGEHLDRERARRLCETT